MMQHPNKTYVGAAVFFERLADDGWPEEAGFWPIGGCTSSSLKCPDERIPGVRRMSVSHLIEILLRKRN